MFRTTACLLSLLSLSFSSSLLLLLLFFYLAIRRVCFRGTDITIIIIIDHFYMNCFLDQQIRSTSLVFSFFCCCCCCCCCCSLFVYRICTEFDSGEILAHSTLLFESILLVYEAGTTLRPRRSRGGKIFVSAPNECFVYSLKELFPLLLPCHGTETNI